MSDCTIKMGEEASEILLMIADEERKHLSVVKNIYSLKFPALLEFGNLKEY